MRLRWQHLAACVAGVALWVGFVMLLGWLWAR
jgi:hypothetical protein